jgi:hypothetical protein
MVWRCCGGIEEKGSLLLVFVVGRGRAVAEEAGREYVCRPLVGVV